MIWDACAIAPIWGCAALRLASHHALAILLDPPPNPLVAHYTQQKKVYVVAKRMTKRCTADEYAIALAKHFVHTYPRASLSFCVEEV